MILIIFLVLFVHINHFKITECNNIAFIESPIEGKFYIGITCIDTIDIYDNLNSLAKTICDYENDICKSIIDNIKTIKNSKTCRLIEKNQTDINIDEITHFMSIPIIHEFEQKIVLLNQIIEVEYSLYAILIELIKTIKYTRIYADIPIKVEYNFYRMEC